MLDNTQKSFLIAESEAMTKKTAIRYLYTKPVLQKLGDIRPLTLGGSPGGIGDSLFINTKP